MNLDFDPAWYCARTKPKHEHIAAANIITKLGLEVFNPRLRMERPTQLWKARFAILMQSHCACFLLKDAFRFFIGCFRPPHLGAGERGIC